MTASIIVCLAVALFSRRPTPEELERRIVLVREPRREKIARAVQALPEETCSELLKQRDRALAVLRDRGLIDADSYEHAVATDLGRLSWPAAAPGGSAAGGG